MEGSDVGIGTRCGSVMRSDPSTRLEVTARLRSTLGYRFGNQSPRRCPRQHRAPERGRSRRTPGPAQTADWCPLGNSDRAHGVRGPAALAGAGQMEGSGQAQPTTGNPNHAVSGLSRCAAYRGRVARIHNGRYAQQRSADAFDDIPWRTGTAGDGLPSDRHAVATSLGEGGRPDGRSSRKRPRPCGPKGDDSAGTFGRNQNWIMFSDGCMQLQNAAHCIRGTHGGPPFPAYICTNMSTRCSDKARRCWLENCKCSFST